MYKLLNPAINALLKSPVHRILSRRLMTVYYRGRKSSKSYATPVSYYKAGNSVYCFTNGAWWHNFRQAKEVELRIRGRLYKGMAIAELAATPANIDIMARYFKAVRSDAKYYGVGYEKNGEPVMTTVQYAAIGMKIISITLENRPDELPIS